MTSFLIFLAIVAAIVFWAIGMYNRLVNERNRVRNGFAQIDVQLTRRHDLIPNLVEAVKGYMKHERETLDAANQNMMQFQEELASTENKVSFARQAFNDAVMSYNNAVENFPNNFIAGMFKFEPASFLEIEAEEMRQAPDVKFT